MSFNLEEHLKFVEDVKNNPHLYEPKGEQIYCSPNGIGYWINRNEVCPICGSSNGFYKVIGNRNNKGWNECMDCGWKGNDGETLPYEEYINNNRNRRLREILL
jgi:hypothetical protein